MKFRLTRNESRTLPRFVKRTRDKMEYIRASVILMRSRGMKVKQVASSLQVCMGAVFKWERLYRRKGLDGLRSRKPTGRPAIRGEKARRLIPELMKKDPQAFGFLKGGGGRQGRLKGIEERGCRDQPNAGPRDTS